MERETRKIDQNNRCVIVPPVDIYEENHVYTLKADLPGVTKENLDIAYENGELTISPDNVLTWAFTSILSLALFRKTSI